MGINWEMEDCPDKCGGEVFVDKCNRFEGYLACCKECGYAVWGGSREDVIKIWNSYTNNPKPDYKGIAVEMAEALKPFADAWDERFINSVDYEDYGVAKQILIKWETMKGE